MHKPKSVRENGDFEIQMDHLISVRRSDQVVINKKKKKKKKKKKRENLPSSGFCRSG